MNKDINETLRNSSERIIAGEVRNITINDAFDPRD